MRRRLLRKGASWVPDEDAARKTLASVTVPRSAFSVLDFHATNKAWQRIDAAVQPRTEPLNIPQAQVQAAQKAGEAIRLPKPPRGPVSPHLKDEFDLLAAKISKSDSNLTDLLSQVPSDTASATSKLVLPKLDELREAVSKPPSTPIDLSGLARTERTLGEVRTEVTNLHLEITNIPQATSDKVKHHVDPPLERLEGGMKSLAPLPEKVKVLGTSLAEVSSSVRDGFANGASSAAELQKTTESVQTQVTGLHKKVDALPHDSHWAETVKKFAELEKSVANVPKTVVHDLVLKIKEIASVPTTTLGEISESLTKLQRGATAAEEKADDHFAKLATSTTKIIETQSTFIEQLKEVPTKKQLKEHEVVIEKLLTKTLADIQSHVKPQPLPEVLSTKQIEDAVLKGADLVKTYVNENRIVVTGDISSLKSEIKSEIASTKVKEDIASLKNQVTAEITSLKRDLTAEIKSPNKQLKEEMTLLKDMVKSETTSATSDIKAEITSTNNLVKEEIASLKNQITVDITSLNKDLKAENAWQKNDLKAEIASQKNELKAEIASQQNELKAEIASQKNELKA